VNRRAEAEIQALSRKVHYLTDIVGDLHDHIHPHEPRRDEELQG
jgi:CRP/FNR family cyclic AMP-dependent transcriptional regulator